MLSGKRRRQRGLTLVELVVAFTIMLILSSLAMPLTMARMRVRRERALRRSLREVRLAIDRYKDFCEMGVFGRAKLGTNCYPETLEILVEGKKMDTPDGKKLRLLRRIPPDPFTGKTEWGMRSDADDPKSTSWGGQDLFDVYTKTQEKAPDGTPYSEW